MMTPADTTRRGALTAAVRRRARTLPPLPQTSPPPVDLPGVHRQRLATLRAEMKKRGIGACLLFDAVNIRYATGARNMQVFTSRNPASRYAFVPADGNVVLFEFPGCAHLAAGTAVDEVRPAITASAVAAEARQEEMCKRWADEIADLAAAHCRDSLLGMEAATVCHQQALTARGFRLVDAQQAVEAARAQKSADEILLIKSAIAATDAGVHLLRDAVYPGISENELWSLLHQAIIAADGDYVETRLLSSGERSCPWFQESSPRRLESGDLVALDTDVVGPFGYYADYSRTFYCGRGKPSARQRDLYKMAYQQVHHNLENLYAGASFREIAERGWKIPDRFIDYRYFVLAHGVGMTGEHPYILHQCDFDEWGYDGVLAPMTTLSVESYIGDGNEGVKLEQQVLITENGREVLSNFPFEEALLGREI